jgi:hypothetical protein
MGLDQDPTDQLQLEKLRSQYRQQGNWRNPIEIKNTDLFTMVDRLYRLNAKVGSGSTADALRYETAFPKTTVGSKLHSIKAKESARKLEKLIRYANLNAHDSMIAENVRLDLLDSIGDKLWYSQTNTPKF